MNTKFYLGVFMCVALLAGTNSASAYTSNSHSAEQLGENYRLFSVGFSWGFADRDLLIPVLATRGLASNTELPALGYQIESENGLRVKHGTTTAMVVANLPIENGYYRLKAGETAEFRLLALHESASSTQPLKLQVSALPFKLESKNKVSKTYLNISELRGYITNAI